MYILRTLTRHRRTSMFFCVLQAQVICSVSAVFDRCVAHCFVCDGRFLAQFRLIFHVWRTCLRSYGPLGEALGPFLRPEKKKLQTMSELWCQYGRLGGPWCPPWALWDTLGRFGVPFSGYREAKQHPEVSKIPSRWHRENSVILLCFVWFNDVSSSQWTSE